MTEPGFKVKPGIRPGIVKRDLSKISSPLLDRIDLHVEVTLVFYDKLPVQGRLKITSAEIRTRILQARSV